MEFSSKFPQQLIQKTFAIDLNKRLWNIMR